MSPLRTVLLVAPSAVALNRLACGIAPRPLVRRARSRGVLERDAIPTTFGPSFDTLGPLIRACGADRFSPSGLARPGVVLGATDRLARVSAFAATAVICAAVYLWLHHSRAGMAFPSLP